MRNLFRKLMIVFLCGFSLSQISAQDCPSTVFCINNGSQNIVYLDFPSTTNLPSEVTFILGSTIYPNEVPDLEISNGGQYYYNLPFCGENEVGEGLTLSLIINGVTCDYIDGFLEGTGGGGSAEIPCPVLSGCQYSWNGIEPELFYLKFETFNFQLDQALQNGATFYFDNYPCLNGTYFTSGFENSGSNKYIFFEDFNNILPCDVQDPLHNFTLVLNDGVNEIECVIQDRMLCEEGCPPNIPPEENCEEYLTDCGNSIIEYAQDYLGWDETGCKYWGNSCSPNGIIKRYGKVGIGTNNIPTGYKLAVKGAHGIVTEQFMVCAGAWCDYVFEEGYELMPLKDVEKYIQVNGHLHGFPSESSIVEDGGFDLGEIVFKQQEKIEEAFLHIIDIDKTLNSIDSLIYEK